MMFGKNGFGHNLQFQINRNAGFTLIEALVAVAILAFGVLGLVALQGQMVKNSSESRYRAQAAYFANQLIGNMWLDQASLATKWGVTNGTCTTTSNAACTSWASNLSSSLPNASANVSFVGNLAQVTITWQAPGELPHQFQSEATINN